MTGPRSARRRKSSSHPIPVQNTKPAHKKSSQRELTTKRRGELAELAFTLKAASLGFSVSKPYGDSDRYDFILDADVGADAVVRPASRQRRVTAPWPSAKVAKTPKNFSFRYATEANKGSSRRAAKANKALSFRRASTPRQEEPAFPPPAGCPTRSLPRAKSKGDVRRVGSPPARPTLHRIQVKCSTQLLNGLYRVNAHRRTHGRAVPYLASEIDFLAAYIVPEDTWYIIPVAAIRGSSLLFRRRRDRRPGLYDVYREAWHLLRAGVSGDRSREAAKERSPRRKPWDSKPKS
jgi:hypothetical protein